LDEKNLFSPGSGVWASRSTPKKKKKTHSSSYPGYTTIYLILYYSIISSTTNLLSIIMARRCIGNMSTTLFQKWILVAHVLLFIIIGQVTSKPLPTCKELPPNYLPPTQILLGCGLPSSRSYLHSKFNAALVADESKTNQVVELGKEVFVDIEACEISRTDESRLWRDNITVLTSTPWTLESCQETEVNFWGRIRSESSLHRVIFRAMHTKTSCKWQAVFTPSVPGDFVLEISNIWIRGSTYSHASEFKEVTQAYWEGVNEVIPHPSAIRGSNHIPCGDYCSSMEGCAYYVMKGGGRSNCLLFGGNSTPTLFKNTSKVFKGFAAGMRKTELPSVHVGGITGGFHGSYNSGPGGEICHNQSHVVNSPQPFKVVKSTNQVPTERGVPPYYDRVLRATDGSGSSDVFCDRGDLPGHWVRWDSSGCPATREEEVERMATESKAILVGDLATHHGVKALYHQATDTVVYAFHSGDHKKLFSLSLPNETTPPWQLYPRCAVGYQAIPPGSTQHVPAKNQGARPTTTALTRVSYSSRSEVLKGLTYVPSSGECIYRHYSRGQMRQCLHRLQLKSIAISGDSILGGFNAVLKWFVGVSGGVSEGWYLPRAEGEERNIATSSVATEQGGLRTEGVRCVLWGAQYAISRCYALELEPMQTLSHLTARVMSVDALARRGDVCESLQNFALGRI
jgi:hypothetical protein